MSFLHLLRFTKALTAVAVALAGFFIVRFAGVSDGNFRMLPLVLFAVFALTLASSLWDEWFDADRKKNTAGMLATESTVFTSVFVAGMALTAAGILAAMAVSVIAFYLAAGLLAVIFFNAIFIARLPLLASVFSGLLRFLVMSLGVSAHAELIWLYREPAVFLPPLLLGIYAMSIRALADYEYWVVEEGKVGNPDGELSTEFDENMQSLRAIGESPQTRQWQNEWERLHSWQVLTKQNRSDRFVKLARMIILSPFGVRLSLAVLLLAPAAATIVLPQTLVAAVFAAIWWGVMAKPAFVLWRAVNIENQREIVALAGAMEALFAALLTAGFCWNFLADGGQTWAPIGIAAAAVPVFVWRREIR